ncbi:MAG: peptidylprolyl isomerase, partial [Acidobacteriota bacterium]
CDSSSSSPTTVVNRTRAVSVRVSPASASSHSNHPSAGDGGDVGWVSRRQLAGRFGLDVLRALLALELGEVGEIFRTDSDFAIVRLDGLEAKRPMTLEEARPQIEQRLGQMRADELRQAVLAELAAELEFTWRSGL